MLPVRRKLIEVTLPLEAVNKASASEKGNPFLKGHPRNIHQWWARRPLATARAVIFAQMVDDPSANPDLFPTEQKQQKERQRLFKIIEELVKWENTTNEEVLNLAREEIWQSWRRTCAEHADDARAKALFDREVLPVFHDPFAGGGALPLEAQRLGLVSYASDLNPVAVLINKAMIEIPPRFAGMSPVNPEARKNPALLATKWKGAQGLAEDLRYFGRWMRDEAEKRIGQLYPRIEVTEQMAKDRKDLKPFVGQKLTVIAWLWARTVKSPNPAFANVEVPLASTFLISNKKGKEAYVEPLIENGGYRFAVRTGPPKDFSRTKRGTKLSRGANFECLMSGIPIGGDYIKGEGVAGRFGARLMAIVAESAKGRVYLEPNDQHERVAKSAVPSWSPDESLPLEDTANFWCSLYGLTVYGNLFAPRQLVALNTFSELISETRDVATKNATEAWADTPGENNAAPTEYGNAIATYAALAVDKLADYNNSLCTWNPTNQNVGHLFTKQAIPMAWDYAEATPLDAGLSIESIADGLARSLEMLPSMAGGKAFQQDCAGTPSVDMFPVISTDPPYFDNISYADLSDFFYVWLRRSLRSIYPDLFSTLTVPKAEELVATPYRHGSSTRAETFFLEGMSAALQQLAERSHPAFPLTIFYAFKQSESEGTDGLASTGWETFLEAVIRAGLAVSGTWPVRTEREARAVGQGTNALASSIVLVCRARHNTAASATRRDLVASLKAELPIALLLLQRSNIAPVDLAQAAIGPGMAVYTRFSKVVDAEGRPVPVRDALALINQVLDETLAEQEGDFDADSRWALAWFEQHGFLEGEFGVADVLARAKNTSVQGMVDGGFIASKRGKVRLLKSDELPEDWDPETDSRLSAWETVHHLIRALEAGGEPAAAVLMKKLGARAEVARELAYRLYSIAERKKRAAEALQYNALVQSWLEIARLSQEAMAAAPVDRDLFDDA